MDSPKIGGHVSAAGGIYKAVKRAEDIGADCLQIFGASPRQWSAKSISAEDAEKFKKKRENSGLGPVFLHAAYLVNLASEKKDLCAKSVKSLKDHLAICEALGAEGLIFHPGSATGGDVEEAIEFVAKGMKEVLGAVSGSVKLLVENTAGGGTKLGEDPAQIAAILKGVKSKRTGVCFDTAHGFEAGTVDFSSQEKLSASLDKWNKELGLDTITVVHVNDSKTEFASNHDKHENIGEGYIGTKGFKYLAKDVRLNSLPWILEVPGFDGNGPDAENIKRLRAIF